MEAIVDFNDSLRYCMDNYLTLDELAAQSNTPVERIEELIEAKCIPPHSHEIARQSVVISSAFGDFVCSQSQRFYAPSSIEWIAFVKQLPVELALDAIRERQFEAFGAEFRQALLSSDGARQAYADCFREDENLATEAVEAEINQAWDYVMDGTYGVCLQRVCAESIVKKGIAVYQLEQALRLDPNTLTSQQRRCINEAIELYNAVASQFAPHEYGQSSRARILNAVIHKFGMRLDD